MLIFIPQDFFSSTRINENDSLCFRPSKKEKKAGFDDRNIKQDDIPRRIPRHTTLERKTVFKQKAVALLGSQTQIGKGKRKRDVDDSLLFVCHEEDEKTFYAMGSNVRLELGIDMDPIKPYHIIDNDKNNKDIESFQDEFLQLSSEALDFLLNL